MAHLMQIGESFVGEVADAAAGGLIALGAPTMAEVLAQRDNPVNPFFTPAPTRP